MKTTRSKHGPIVGITIFALIMAHSAVASTGRETGFRPLIRDAGHTLLLRGTGVLRYKMLIPVYDAALYLGEGVGPAEVMADAPKRIEVRYRVSADADRFARAGDRILEENFSREEIARIKDRLDTLNSWYPDPRPGDVCAITYIPGKGTELSFNGRSLGWIQGEDFARMYFAIWLGPQPASTSLRKALLGASNG